MPQPKVTLKIPKPLYDHIKFLIADSGFNSVTDFVVFVLRDIIYEGRHPGRPGAAAGAAPSAAPAPSGATGATGATDTARTGGAAPGASGATPGGEGGPGEFSGEDLEKIKEKLRGLGYL